MAMEVIVNMNSNVLMERFGIIAIAFATIHVTLAIPHAKVQTILVHVRIKRLINRAQAIKVIITISKEIQIMAIVTIKALRIIIKDLHHLLPIITTIIITIIISQVRIIIKEHQTIISKVQITIIKDLQLLHRITIITISKAHPPIIVIKLLRHHHLVLQLPLSNQFRLERMESAREMDTWDMKVIARSFIIARDVEMVILDTNSLVQLVHCGTMRD
jgi:hypothetical protein